MTYPSEFYEPRQGIRPGMTAPASLDWRYPDPNVPLTVFLVVHDYPIPAQPNPRDRHWALCWEQGYALRTPSPSPSPGAQAGEPERVAVARVLEVRREDGREHCTFWGPVTQCVRAETLARARVVPVARLTLRQRRFVEKLAGAVRIMKPNGWWNGQNWVVEVLKSAADQDVITPEQRDTAILAAAQP